MKDIILGIDLGTSNSVASVWNGFSYTIIKNKDSYLFPSVIEFTQQGKIVCNSDYDNKNSIKNIKRFIGQDLKQINILNFLSDLNFDYKIYENKVKIFNKYENKFYFLEELNALILKFIVENANIQLDQNITNIVITIPAHFNEIQRNSIIISTKLANLNCLRIINEPTAASLAYGLNIHDDVNILVFDLGGGTFDLSILNIDCGIYEVLSTNGDNLLGGEDFTNILLDDVLMEFRKKYDSIYELKNNIIEKNISDLKYECEKFKCNIIDNIYIRNFYVDKDINLDLVYRKNRNELFNIFKKLFNRIESHLETVISSSNLKNEEIDYVVMVGGGTKMIEVSNFIKLYFSNNRVVFNLDPDLVVSIGAAIQGFILKNPDNNFSKNIALVDVLPLSIGIESDNGIMTKIIKKNTKLPIRQKKNFTNEDDDQSEVEIKIYQGERKLVKDNKLIGNLKLLNLQKRKRGKNIICIEISVNYNCMIEVTACEKNTDNLAKLKIEKKDILFDEKIINQMILEGNKYDEIDNLKCKLYKNFNKLKLELKNLEYNYSNEYIELSDNEKKNLSIHINYLKLEIIEIEPILKNDLSNDDYIKLIEKIKKLLKINDKKYSMLIQFYDNNKNKDIVADKNIELKIEKSSKEFNSKLISLINENIKSIKNLSNTSKYTKNNIISFLKNKSYKLESIILDSESYDINLNEIKNLIKIYFKEDSKLINNFGNIDMIKKLLIKNNIKYDITNFYNLNPIEIFDLLFDICQQFNLQIN